MWIEKSNGTQFTTLYRKETDRNTLLQGAIFLPDPLKRLPRSPFFRLRPIYHSTEDYLEKAAEMPNRFLVRGNSPQCVDEALHLILVKTWEELLQKRPAKAKEHSVMFITTYTLNSRKVGNAVKKHWHILSSDPVLPAELKNPPLIVYRRRQSARPFYALYQMVAINAENAHSATIWWSVNISATHTQENSSK